MTAGGELSSQPQPEEPRVAPGTRKQIGLATAAVLKVAARANGGGPPPHVMTTLARHRRLFRGWIHFASTLMPRGTLERADTELVILRVAHLCGSEYEWRHHAAIAAAAGLSAEDVECIRGEGAIADRWAPRQAALLRAVDELHADQRISDAVWAELSAFFDDERLIEVCMLAGHYQMLAMTLNSLRVAPDAAHGAPRLLGRRGRQRSRPS
jgi:alkylhydroperoxidase family enzyme